MSDETVIVREQGTIFLGGPPLVKAATGEEVTAEELGGGDVHARTSGVVDHLAEDDEHALEIVRDIVATLPRAGPRRRGSAAPPRPPAEDPDELLDVVPLDTRTPYDVRDLLRRLVDGARAAGVQGAVRHDASSARSRTSTATRSGSSPTTGSCSASPR